jgi:hypothetical protein
MMDEWLLLSLGLYFSSHTLLHLGVETLGLSAKGILGVLLGTSPSGLYL